MPLAGLVLNRVQQLPAAQLSAARSLAAAEVPAGGRGRDGETTRALAIAALKLHAERMEQAAAQRRTAEQFTAAHPLVPVARDPGSGRRCARSGRPAGDRPAFVPE